MFARVYSCAVIGLDGVVVEVEVDTGDGLPGIIIVGTKNRNFFVVLFIYLSQKKIPGCNAGELRSQSETVPQYSFTGTPPFSKDK